MKIQLLFVLMMIPSTVHAGLTYLEHLYKNEATQVSYIINQFLREKNPSSWPNVSVSKLQLSQAYRVCCDGKYSLYNPLTKKLKLDNQLIDLSNIVSRLDTFIQKQKDTRRRRSSALTQAAATYFCLFPEQFSSVSLRSAFKDIDDAVAMTIEYEFDNERREYAMWYVPDLKKLKIKKE